MVANLFCSYSTNDEVHRIALEEALAGLRNSGALATWTFRRLLPGDDLDSGIDVAMNDAHVIVLLVSSSFLNSDYCWNVEMKSAVKRHDDGLARIVPVVVRPCDWKDAPFARLNALPTDARPVTDWSSADQAWLSVAQGIRRVIESISAGERTRRIIESATSPNGQQLERGAGGFLSPMAVLSLVLSQSEPEAKPAADPFVLYENPFQRTWLVVTQYGMTCVLDDLTKGPGYSPLRWSEVLDDVLPIIVEGRPASKGLVHFGSRHHDWFYSTHLHADAGTLQRTLEHLVEQR